MQKNNPAAAMTMRTDATGDIGDDRGPKSADPAVTDHDSTTNCSPFRLNAISMHSTQAVTTRTDRNRIREVCPICLTESRTRMAPNKIHMSIALSERVLHPRQTLLKRMLPVLFPIMPAMQVRMARMAQEAVIFLKRSVSALPREPSASWRKSGMIVMYFHGRTGFCKIR